LNVLGGTRESQTNAAECVDVHVRTLIRGLPASCGRLDGENPRGARHAVSLRESSLAPINGERKGKKNMIVGGPLLSR
jgi:hypothetical protein